MSRKWDETIKACQCKSCEYFDGRDTCEIDEHTVLDPHKWRFCKQFSEVNYRNRRNKDEYQ